MFKQWMTTTPHSSYSHLTLTSISQPRKSCLVQIRQTYTANNFKDIFTALNSECICTGKVRMRLTIGICFCSMCNHIHWLQQNMAHSWQQDMKKLLAASTCQNKGCNPGILPNSVARLPHGTANCICMCQTFWLSFQQDGR